MGYHRDEFRKDPSQKNEDLLTDDEIEKLIVEAEELTEEELYLGVE